MIICPGSGISAIYSYKGRDQVQLYIRHNIEMEKGWVNRGNDLSATV
jgi:hypothetical protein